MGTWRERLLAAFERAWDERPNEAVEERFAVGGRPVSARIAGRALARTLRRSLAPAPGQDVAGGLRLDLWDEEATGVPAPPRPGADPHAGRHGPAGERFLLSDDRRHVLFHGPHFVIRLDRDARHAVGWVRAESELSSWHRARPLQTLLMPWLADEGLTVVHAAMVARGGRGIVLAGPGMSGKSTAVAACAAAGFDLLGDDTVALEVDGDAVLGHCVHAAVKLRRQGLERHTALAGRTVSLGPPWQDEEVAFFGEAFPRQLATSARVVTVAFPHLGAADATRSEPESRGRALRALTGCLLSAEPGSAGQGMEALAEMVLRVPAFRVAIGRETDGIPAELDALLARISG